MPFRAKAGQGKVKVFGIGKKSAKGKRSLVVTLPRKELDNEWDEGTVLSFYVKDGELTLKKNGKK